MNIEFDVYKQKLNDCKPALEGLADSLNLVGLKNELERLQAMQEAPGFWDDPDKSQKIVVKTKQAETKVERYEQMLASWDDLMTICEMAAEEDDDSMLEELKDGAIITVPNDASNALKELSKHMIDQTRFEDNPNVLEESVVLRHELSAFQTKLTNGTLTQADIDSLVEEFTILQNAAKVYREQGNEAIAYQIEPWLGNWDDQTLAILSYLDALSAILNNEGDDAIWSGYANGQAAFESSKNHPLWYLDHYEYAESGYRFIVPFMKALDAYLAEYVKDIVDPSGSLSGGGSGGGAAGTPLRLTAFEGNNPGYYSGNLNNVVDGNTGTTLSFENVIALYTDQTRSADGTHEFFNTIGSGEGYLAMNGKIVPILWSRESLRSPFVYTNGDGTPVSLSVGNSYVAIVGTKTPISYK